MILLSRETFAYNQSKILHDGSFVMNLFLVDVG